MSTREELVAANMSVEEIRDFIGADSLAYLELPALVEATGAPRRHVLPRVLRRASTRSRCRSTPRRSTCSNGSRAMSSGAYRRAGVDLEAAAEATRLIADLAAKASRPEVVEGVGGFAGLFRIGDGRLLAAATDGVGTKLEIARLAGRFDTVGIDLVAMCANDVVCTGAEPLLFLDYLAVGRLVPEQAAAVVAGVAEGCRRAGCALLGGETAEHPGVLDPERFDLAGFCVGALVEDHLVGAAPRRRRRRADRVAVVRPAFERVQPGPEGAGGGPPGSDRHPRGARSTLGDELLEPTLIYVPAILALAQRGLIHAAAHITGGGIPENLPRALPEGLGAEVDRGAWEAPPVFSLLGRLSRASSSDLLRTLNMGMGMILVVPSRAVPQVEAVAADHGFQAMPIGLVDETSGVRIA